jgi:O-antigen/teichoic acid export membrane protein
VDNLFVRGLCGDEPLGRYNVAVRVLSASIMLAQYASLTALPWFTRRHEAGDLGGAIARLGAPLFALAGLGCGLLWPWGEPLLELFGEGFGQAAGALRWLLLATLAIYAGSLLLTGVVAAGDTRSMLWIALAGLVVNVVLNAWMVPLWGIDGAAAATFATESCVTLGALVALRRAGVRVAGAASARRWAGGPLLFVTAILVSRVAGRLLGVLLGWS